MQVDRFVSQIPPAPACKTLGVIIKRQNVIANIQQ